MIFYRNILQHRQWSFFYYFVLFEWYFCNYCLIRKIRGDNYRNLYRNLFEREVLRYPQAYQLAGLRFLYTVLKLSWGCPTPFYMLSHLPTSSAVNLNRHAVLFSQGGVSNPVWYAITFTNLVCSQSQSSCRVTLPRVVQPRFILLAPRINPVSNQSQSLCSTVLLSQGLSNPVLYAIAYINLICNWTHLVMPCCSPTTPQAGSLRTALPPARHCPQSE